MTYALAELAADLGVDVPALDGIPTQSQYNRCVKDAVADFSRRAGRVKRATLSLVAGTASYALPSDFMRMLWLEGLENLSLTVGYFPAGETWYISGSNIVFTDEISSTPVTYTVTRPYEYQPAWVLDANGDYDMTDEEQRIAMLLAQSLAVGKKANRAIDLAWQYQIGDERANKEKLAEKMQAREKELEAKYLESVANYIGSFSTMRWSGGVHD